MCYDLYGENDNVCHNNRKHGKVGHMETKRITPAFGDRALSSWSAASIKLWLEDIENTFKECNEELSAAEMSECDYEFQGEKISELAEDMVTLQTYVGSAHAQVSMELDQPLYEDFKNNATESLSRIILGDLTTDNTFGLEEYCEVPGRGTVYRNKRVKKNLTIEDFLGVQEVTEYTGMPVLENIETVGEFASLFRMDYDTMKMSEEEINACIESYITNGEFDHKAYHPVGDFLSGMLDVVPVKPLIESFTGKDLITQEQLTDAERGMKFVEACVGFFTFGQGALAIKAAGATGKQALMTLGKTVLVDALADTAAYTVGYGCDALGMPMEVTLMLSLFTGCTVSIAGGKYLLKDTAGVVVKEIAPEDVDDILKAGMEGKRGTDSTNQYCLSGEEHYEAYKEMFGAENVEWTSRDTLSNADRLRIQNWEHPPKDELYIKYKDVYQNDLYFDQATGAVNWPAFDGFVPGTITCEVLKEDMYFMRIGAPSGEFLGTTVDAFEKRSLAPFCDPNLTNAEIHYYRLTEDYELVTGEIAPWFGFEGGGTQFLAYKSDGTKYTIQ